MRQGWLKEILDENRRTVEDWPEWKKSQQSERISREGKDDAQVKQSAKKSQQ